MNIPRTLRTFCILFPLLFAAGSAWPSATEQFHRTCTLRPGTPVIIENVSGTISVTVQDGSDADILAVKHTKFGQKELDRVSIEVALDGSLTIRTNYRKNESSTTLLSRIFNPWGSNANVNVDYTIRLPRTAVLQKVSSVSGDIELSGVSGDISAKSVSGSVRIRDAAGGFDLSTVSGDITARDMRGDITVHSISGDIRVDRAAGTVNAHSTSGSIDITADMVKSASSVSGNVIVAAQAVNETMNFSAVSGDIRVRVPSGTNADLDLNTTSGKISIPEGLTMRSGTISKHSISARIGSGGRMISMKTISGSITLDN
jgi:DUF4097 and DUF4098 domain-containing protein YvlB